MVNIEEVFVEINKKRTNINELLKQKKMFAQSEYEEMRAEAERIKSKYAKLTSEVNQDIANLGRDIQGYSDALYKGAFISIQDFANGVAQVLSDATLKPWEIVAIAFSYKKRVRDEGGLKLVPTDANIIAVVKSGAFSKDLTDMIFVDKDWLLNNRAMMGFLDMINRGDIVLLHIVENENRAEKILNLFESGFNSDFDKHLLRFELEYNEKNPVHKYPALVGFMDRYIYSQLSKKK